MSEIVRRSQLSASNQIARVDRTTGKALEAIRNDGLLHEADEFVAARLAQLRIDAANQLATRAVFEIKGLHSLVTELTRDNPALEMELRSFAGIVSIGSQQVIANYLMRPL